MGFLWQSVPMPIIEFAKEYLGPEAIVIETGTYLGDGAALLSKHFREVITIELDERLASDATERFLLCPAVRVICGESNGVLNKYPFAECTPYLFWLEAHYSSGSTAGEDDPCPLILEIDTIVSKLPPNSPYLILIDDVRCIGTEDGWPTWTEIVELTHKNGLEFGVFDDVMVIGKETVSLPSNTLMRCSSSNPM